MLLSVNFSCTSDFPYFSGSFNSSSCCLLPFYLSYVAVSRPGHLLQFIPNRPGLYIIVRIKGAKFCILGSTFLLNLVESSHYTAVDHYIYSEYNYEIS